MGKSKKPTGISISRKKYKFIVTWKRGEKYTSQQVHYKINNGSWHEINNVGKTSTKEHFTLSESKWAPEKSSKKVKTITVKITGKAKGDSKTSSKKTIRIKKPSPPHIDIYEVGNNNVIFTVSRPNEKEKRPITRIDYEWVAVEKFNEKPKTASYWESDKTKGNFKESAKNITAAIDGITETESKTIILRARCRGIGGNSNWTYKYHVLGYPFKPQAPTIENVAIDKNTATTKIRVKWSARSEKYQPIDATLIQYIIGVPEVRRDYEEYTDIRGDSEADFTSSGCDVPVPRNSYPSKIIVYDEDGETIIPSTKYTYSKMMPNDNETYIRILMLDTTLNPSEAEVYWISSDYTNGTTNDVVYIYDSVNGLYTPATYEQICDFDTEYTFYKLESIFDIPQGATWTDGVTQKDTEDYDYALLKIDSLIGYDQCIWVRIATIHDELQSESDYVLAYKGDLAPPTITQIETDSDPYTAQVTVTNNSTVSGSFVALIYQDADSSDYSGKILGLVPAGDSVSEPIQCPVWDGHEPYTFGAYAVYGRVNDKDTKTEEVTGLSHPITIYSLYEDMKSSVVYNGGHVPVAPSDVTADKVEGRPGTVQVTWKSPWKDATGAEISWADHDDAWYSTSGPNSYTVASIKQPKLNISDLATGIKWYICVRLYRQIAGGEVIYGPMSEMKTVDLSEAPSVPVVTVSPTNVISEDEDIKVSWVYVVEDNSEQASAELVEVIDNEYKDDSPLKQFTTEQMCVFKPSDFGWEAGSEHSIAVRVRSTGEKDSPWSNPVSIVIVEPLVCSISSTNLVREDSQHNALDFPELHSLPLEVTVDGAGDNDDISIVVRRFDDYPIVRPNNSEYIGYDGEIVCAKSADREIEIETEDTVVDPEKKYYELDNETGDFTEVTPEGNENPAQEGWYEIVSNNTISIGLEDLEEYGTQFDDEAKYEIVAVIQDKDDEERIVRTVVLSNDNDEKIIPDPNGTDEMFEFFQIHWDTQAIIPNEQSEWITAHIQLDETEEDKRWPLGIAIIQIGGSPIQDDTAHLDIYRLSAGKPQLIYQGATFNTDYVDPYPTIGKRGGYRVVYITENGDYITDDGPAWVDIPCHLDTKFQLIDFENTQIEFKFNVTLDNSWKKQFTMTHYLGGKIEGDWVAGVEHTHNIKGITIDNEDIEGDTLDSIRELAEYSGLCHIRTIEGFNYTANIDVSDSSEYNHPDHDHNISLTVTEVENTGTDGMTLEDWNKDEEEAE